MEKHNINIILSVEDCIWEWGPYGQCTEPCDGGTRTRSPNVIRAAAHGGRPCPDPETEPCNTQPCPGT